MNGGVTPLKFIDWFAGIGGFRAGMEQAGHECIGFCEYDLFATRSYIAMHLLTDDEKMKLKNLEIRKAQKYIDGEIIPRIEEREWYRNDVRTVNAADIPRADCWCFGFPCQDISVAGKQVGFNGHRSSLFFAVTKLIRELEEKDRPSYLLIENVKNLLSVNRGFDFAKLLVELDEIGYDAEWQVINSADFVPQNRERVFIAGHFRGRSTSKVFPIEGADRKNNLEQIGNFMPTKKRDNPNQGRIYNPEGVSPCLNKMDGGGREPHVAMPMFCDLNYGAGLHITKGARCLQARYYKGISNRGREVSGVVVIAKVNKSQDGKVFDIKGQGQSLSAGHNNSPKIAIPVSTPERVVKHQNGRRFKKDGEPMFTLTSQDRHGVVITVEDGAIYAIWSEKFQCYIAIRRLTPKECFRLQGWNDEYFERASLVSSDSKLYKQAGNGVTVPVIYAIGVRL